MENKLFTDDSTKPELYSVQATFTQEGSCIDGGHEEIIIQLRGDLGLDYLDDGFFTIKTKSWSVDSIQDLEELFNRLKKTIQDNGK
jgi:hypothetical protein